MVAMQLVYLLAFFGMTKAQDAQSLLQVRVEVMGNNIDTPCSGCEHGTCQYGVCTCEWGYGGSQCGDNLHAFAFLFYGNSTPNLVRAQVMIQSSRQGGAHNAIYAIIPDKYRSITPPEFERSFEQAGVRLYYSTHIEMPPTMLSDPIIASRWEGVMDKFAVWQLTNHTKVALVDIDAVFDPAGEPVEALFRECHAELCAAQDGDPRYMNAGLLVITPSQERLRHLQGALAVEHKHYDMPEQSFLTDYVKDPQNQMTFQYLDPTWNSCGHGAMMFNNGSAFAGSTFLHACSWGKKYADFKLTWEDPESTRHSLLVWKKILSEYDACIDHGLEDTCVSDQSCNWCGHYCMQDAIACDAELFAYPHPGFEDVDILGALESCTMQEASSPKPIPVEFLSWPVVGVYQVLLDRFASPDESHCANLEDYCGGTLAAAEGKVGYLKKLGVDGVILSPTEENMPHGYHGYWPKNLSQINPHFGTAQDLNQLVFRAHVDGMKVIADLNLNHAGSPVPETFQDYASLSPFNKSQYFHDPSCAMWVEEDFTDGSHDLETCSVFGMADYNHEDHTVQVVLDSFVREHVDTYGFDAIRIDAARHIPHSFLSKLPSEGSPVPAYYEVPDIDLGHVSSYSTQDRSAIYNYPMYYAMRDAFVPGKQRSYISSLEAFLKHEYSRVSLNFLDNNDVPRFVRLLGGSNTEEARVLYHNALAYLMMAPGVPIILYGSEQDVTGNGSSSNPMEEEMAHIWRPTLWETGYNTSRETFQLMQKLLWLRRHYHGFHVFQPEVLIAGRNVLAFLRADVLVAVRNDVKPMSQVIWGNSTLGCKVKRLCNLLSPQECIFFSPGLPTQIDFSGNQYAKVFVPEEVLKEWMASQTAPDVGTTFRLTLSEGWSSMPNPPAFEVYGIPRIHREPQADNIPVQDAGDPDHLLPSVNVSMYGKDASEWFPPLLASPTHDVRVTLSDACVAPITLPEYTSSWIIARRKQGNYVLCRSDDDPMCQRSRNTSAVLNSTALEFHERPLVWPAAGIFSGYYHAVVEMLSRLPPYLSMLRDGRLDLLTYAETPALALYVFKRLGIRDSQIIPLPGNGICSRKLLWTDHANDDLPVPLPSGIAELRSELGSNHRRSAGNGTIVVLSRGDDYRRVSNEKDVVQALQGFGRQVIVHYATANNIEETMDVIGNADMLLGPHGANLANMIFAPSHVKVVEILPVVPFHMSNFHFRTLAGTLRFSYRQVAQEVQDYNRTLAKTSPDMAVDSFRVDVSAVKDAVASLFAEDY